MNTNKIRFMAVVVLIVLFGCQSPKVAQDSSPRETAGRLSVGPEQRRPHLVFFIHGYRDDGSTFIDFPDLLREQLSKYNIRVFMLKYPSIGTSASPWLNVFDFAKAINSQIISTFVEQHELDVKNGFKYPVDNSTTYTIIGHSQGGLVTMNYLNTCLYQDPRKNNDPNAAPLCKYDEGSAVFDQAIGSQKPADLSQNIALKKDRRPPPNFRNFISLGSPFWGSGVINGLMGRPRARAVAKHFTTAFPWVQAENLSIGGISSTVARVWLLNRESDANWTEETKWQSRYPESLRFFTLSGYIGDSAQGFRRSPEKMLRAIAVLANPALYETDFVLPLPESSPNFFYSIENSHRGQPAFEGRTELPQAFLPLKMIHGNVSILPSLSTVKRDNWQAHATFQTVKYILLNTSDELLKSVPMDAASTRESVQAYDRGIHRMLYEAHIDATVDIVKNFTNEVKFITPMGYHRGFGIRDSDVKINPQDAANAFEQIELQNGPLFRAHGTNSRAIKLKHNYYQTYYHIGEFKEDFAWLPKSQPYAEFLAKYPNGFGLNYKVSILGFEPREFKMNSLAGSTSYAEVYLLPYTVFKNEPLSDLSIPSIGKRRTFTLDAGNHLIVNETGISQVAKKFANSSRCYVGVRGLNTPDETDTKRHILPTQDERLQINHQGRLYRQATDRQEVSESLPEGEVVEILGRYTNGFQDQKTGITRPCLKSEAAQNPEACQEPIDRYLVTSNSIRSHDKIAFKQIGLASETRTNGVRGPIGLKGLRWVDVVDIDVFKTTAPIIQGGNFAELPATQCLLDRWNAKYLPAKQMLNQFYSRD